LEGAHFLGGDGGGQLSLGLFGSGLCVSDGVYLFALFQLSRQETRLQVMNTGWALTFLALVRFVRAKRGEVAAALATPLLWTGLEYFRSELYFLRFSWLNVGYAFAWTETLPLFAWLDVQDWGPSQHRLHGRVAPVRAAEYRVPVFRLASSGISQAVTAYGHVSQISSFPGQGEMLAGTLQLGPAARLPLDRWLAMPAAIVAGIIGLWGFWLALWERKKLVATDATAPAIGSISDSSG